MLRVAAFARRLQHRLAIERAADYRHRAVGGQIFEASIALAKLARTIKKADDGDDDRYRENRHQDGQHCSGDEDDGDDNDEGEDDDDGDECNSIK